MTGHPFDTYPWLVPEEAWHPDAPALVEEARDLTSLVPGDPLPGAELHAFLGALTQREADDRIRASNTLTALLRAERARPGWPVVARCLARLGSSDAPGRFLAGANLLDLMTEARTAGEHEGLLPTDWLERSLGLWNDDGRRPLRDEIRRRALHPARRMTPHEAMTLDRLFEHAERAERELDRLR